MRTIEVRQLTYDLTPVAGLALVGDHISLLLSSPTLRQRMDAQSTALVPHVLPMIETLLTRRAPHDGLLPCGWLPVDIDTSAMDNSGTAKEGVGRT